MLRRICGALLLLPALAGAGELDTEFGGHTKFRLVGQSYPDDSLFRDVVGGETLDATAELRLNLGGRSGRWSFDANYQLVGLSAESLPLTGLPGDERRLFDLSSVARNNGDSAVLHRLDRLWAGYAGEKTVVRLGRQALSWGNGLFYAPMDLVNPFDPAAIDTEYKTGDDMLYLQYLRDSGDDVQAAYVARRDPLSGDAGTGVATAAVKYHGFAGENEYDILVAKSYGSALVGAGYSRSVGGAVWATDVVITDTDDDEEIQLVTNLSYSWVAFDRNMSGAVEYYYNGFDQLGRHYVAGSVLIEMNPLWQLTPMLLANVSDPSALFQLVTNYSLGDNLTLLGSIRVPLGPGGTEFGGIESGLPGRYLSTGPGVFAQLAWYF